MKGGRGSSGFPTPFKEPGQVKTRLSPPLSLQDAAELYGCLLRDILEKVGRWLQLSLALAYDPPEFLPFSQRLLPQEGAELGERIARGL